MPCFGEKKSAEEQEAERKSREIDKQLKKEDAAKFKLLLLGTSRRQETFFLMRRNWRCRQEYLRQTAEEHLQGRSFEGGVRALRRCPAR